MCRAALHGSLEYAAQSSRMILGRHYHHGLQMLLVAPSRKRLTFISSSLHLGDVHDIRHAKRRQLANLPGHFALMGKPTADELSVRHARRLIKNRNSL